MLEEHGIVIALDGPYAWVEPRRRSACGHCSTDSCGTGVLAKVFGQKPTRIRVWNSHAAQVGDAVRLGLDEGALLRTSLRVYLVPLLGMFGGALLYESLVPGGDGALAGLAGFFAGLAWVRFSSAGLREDPRYQAVMLGAERA